VILAGPRTGSELLVSLLDSHPQIACDSELFKEARLFPTRFVMGAAARRRGQAWGFKVIDTQLRWQLSRAGADGEFVDRLVERGFRVFRLTRRDLLAQALSLIDAGQSRYHFRQGQAVPDFAPIRVDAAQLISMLHALDDNASWADAVAARVPHRALVYEQDLPDPEAQRRTVALCCEHIGVAPAPAQTDLVARAPTSTRARVENTEEIAASLRTTRFAYLADQLTASHEAGAD
jgi:LPS sulfotransferase NodH